MSQRRSNRRAPASGTSLFERFLAGLHLTASAAVLMFMLWTVADVTGRSLFHRPLPDTPELIAYLLPILVFLQSPFVLRQGRHLRSPIITGRLSPVGQRIMALLTALLGAAFFGVAAFVSFAPAVDAWRGGEFFGQGVLRLPAGPARMIVVLGCALLAVEFARQLAITLRPVRRSSTGAGGEG